MALPELLEETEQDTINKEMESGYERMPWNRSARVASSSAI